MDFKTRQLAINKAFPNAIVLPKMDMRTDEEWSKDLDKIVYTNFPDLDEATLYGGRDSCLPHYHGCFNIHEVDEIDLGSGTKEREAAARWAADTEDFRHGVIYARYHTRPHPIMAVDMALLRGDRLLLGRKPGETAWRFPGGKVDVTDASLEAAARRELQEEAGVFAEHLTYVCSTIVTDWRFRSNPDYKIMTTLFICKEMTQQEPKAGDDLEEIRWVDVNSPAVEIVTAHKDLLTHLQQHLYNKGK